jgi:hypothetical protein
MEVLAKIFLPFIFRKTRTGAIKVKCKLLAFNSFDAPTRCHGSPPPPRHKRCVFSPLLQKLLGEDCDVFPLTNCVQAFAAV